MNDLYLNYCIEARFDLSYNLLVNGHSSQLGLEGSKACDIFNANSDMIEDIWIKINEAAFIVADISDKNPNVFLRIGNMPHIRKK